MTIPFGMKFILKTVSPCASDCKKVGTEDKGAKTTREGWLYSFRNSRHI